MKKKVLSVLLALCLLVGALPLAVSAGEPDDLALAGQAERLEEVCSQKDGRLLETEAPALNAEPKAAKPVSALIEYIRRYGKLNSDGDWYVDYTVVVTEGRSLVRFIYDSSTGNVMFVCSSMPGNSNSVVGAAFEYNSSTSRASENMATVVLNVENRETTGISTGFYIPTYSRNTNLRFSVMSGFNVSGFQELSNATLHLSVLTWELALIKLGVGVSMYDLGFVSYFEDPGPDPAPDPDPVPDPDPDPDPVPTPNPTQFVDVSAGQYYAEAVNWAVENEVTAGTDATHFSPNQSCTRAQAVTFLWRAAGKPEPQGTGGAFTDVKPGAYYEKAVQWAVEQGVTSGTGNGKFQPESKCTRAQIVSFLYRAAGSPEITDGESFSDVKPGAYYENAVQWAAKNGVTSGMGNGKFQPESKCTRAQIVSFLYRYSK